VVYRQAGINESKFYSVAEFKQRSPRRQRLIAMNIVNGKNTMTRATAIAIFFFGIALAAALVYGHGGKKHGAGGEFTNLEALKKATELYDKLVAAEELDMEWETALEKVQLAERRKGAELEKVVSFTRSAGDPKSVYIFFKPGGEYAGSNFTGQ
jgi:hypothetical protein